MLAVCGRQPEPGPALYMPPLLAAVGLFLVLQALAPSSAKPSAASSRAGLLASSQQSKAPPPPVFNFLAANQDVFHAHLLPLAPVSSACPPQVFWMRSFGLGLILPLASCFNLGRAPGCWEGTCSNVTQGCSQGCPSPFVGGTRSHQT